MTEYSIVQAYDAPEYTDLITALYWVASGVLISKEPNGYELDNREKLIWWSSLLGVDNSRLTEYIKTCIKPVKKELSSKEDDKYVWAVVSGTGKKSCTELKEINTALFKQALKKLKEQLTHLLANGIELFGVKRINGELCSTKREIIPEEHKEIKNIDILKETLTYENYEYGFLCVETEKLLEKYPPEAKGFSPKYVQNASGISIMKKGKVTAKNLGGRKRLVTKEDEINLLEYIKINGGADWFKSKSGTVRCNECISFLQQHNKKRKIGEETMRSFLKSIECYFIGL